VRAGVVAAILSCALCWQAGSVYADSAQAGSGAADPPSLFVVFRADHSFFAYLAGGTPVGTTSGGPSVIPAGTYKLILDDTSEADLNFDLAGPGVKLVTNMSHAEEGSAAYFETFQPSSTYTYRNDDQPSVVWTFTTSSEVVASSTTTTSACSTCTTPGKTVGPVVGSDVVPFRGALAASVTSAGKLGLAFKRKPVTTLEAGRYKLTVVDRSRTRGFTLKGPHRTAQAVAGITGVGARTKSITLTSGQWAFYSPGRPKAYFIVVKG
jgi:hypothetical protein